MRTNRSKIACVAGAFVAAMMLFGGLAMNRALAVKAVVADQDWGLSLTSPASSQSDFTVVFNGTITSPIPGFINPFGADVPTLTTPMAGETAITFSGSPPIMASTTVEFELQLNDGLQPLSAYWTDNTMSMTQTAVPVLQFTAPAGSGTPLGYEDAVIEYSGGVDPFSFESMPFYDLPPPPVIVTNPNPDQITLSDAKFFTSDTLIPLDDLNYGSEPPSGSMFNEDFTSPGSLNPQSSVTFDLPEPCSVVGLAGLLGMGLFGLGWCRRRTIG